MWIVVDYNKEIHQVYIPTTDEADRTPLIHLNFTTLDDEKACAQLRSRLGLDLADYLNGGRRPGWLNDMERRESEGLKSLYGSDGLVITVTGPFKLKKNGVKFQQTIREDSESVGRRNELFSRLAPR